MLFASNPTSYSDINGRARLAERHYGVPGAKTSRKMLEFMPAFAHLPPRPFSRFSMDPPVPARSTLPFLSSSARYRPSYTIRLFFHFLFGRSTWNLTRPPRCSLRVRKLFAAAHCSASSYTSPLLPSVSYLLLSAIEHRVPPRDPRYLVKWAWTLFFFPSALSLSALAWYT